jgi:hypothetical protein
MAVLLPLQKPYLNMRLQYYIAVFTVYVLRSFVRLPGMEIFYYPVSDSHTRLSSGVVQ